MNRIFGREEAEKISNGTNPHFIGERGEQAALQKIQSFNQNYDEGAVNSLYGQEIQEYLEDLRTVNVLTKKFNKEEVPNLAIPAITQWYYKAIRRKRVDPSKMLQINTVLNLLPTDRKRDIIAKVLRAKARGSLD